MAPLPRQHGLSLSGGLAPDRDLTIAALIDKHRLAGPDKRFFRLLHAPGNAAVIDGLDAIPLSVLAALSLGRGNA